MKFCVLIVLLSAMMTPTLAIVAHFFHLCACFTCSYVLYIPQLFTLCLSTIICVTLMSIVNLIKHLCFGNIVFTSLLCLLGLPFALVDLVT